MAQILIDSATGNVLGVFDDRHQFGARETHQDGYSVIDVPGAVRSVEARYSRPSRATYGPGDVPSNSAARAGLVGQAVASESVQRRLAKSLLTPSDRTTLVASGRASLNPARLNAALVSQENSAPSLPGLKRDR